MARARSRFSRACARLGGGAAGLCFGLLAVVLGLPVALHFAGLRAGQPPPVEYIANSEVERLLPPSPPTLPEALRGVLWLDLAGAYGHSDIAPRVPGLALSLGDAQLYGRPSARTLALSMTGPGWTWMNRWEGYLAWWWAWQLGFTVPFELGDDAATVLQVSPSVDLGLGGRWSLPKRLLNATMVRMMPPPGTACPPKAGTSKKDVIKCATWDRITTGLLSPLMGSHGVFHYYVYQIVDGQGNRVQPDYDAYLKFADSTCRPNRNLAKLFGLTHPRGTECPTAFSGLPATTSPSIPSSSEAPPLPHRTSDRESGEL